MREAVLTLTMGGTARFLQLYTATLDPAPGRRFLRYVPPRGQRLTKAALTPIWNPDETALDVMSDRLVEWAAFTLTPEAYQLADDVLLIKIMHNSVARHAYFGDVYYYWFIWSVRLDRFVRAGTTHHKVKAALAAAHTLYLFERL